MIRLTSPTTASRNIGFLPLSNHLEFSPFLRETQAFPLACIYFCLNHHQVVLLLLHYYPSRQICYLVHNHWCYQKHCLYLYHYLSVPRNFFFLTSFFAFFLRLCNSKTFINFAIFLLVFCNPWYVAFFLKSQVLLMVSKCRRVFIWRYWNFLAQFSKQFIWGKLPLWRC